MKTLNAIHTVLKMAVIITITVILHLAITQFIGLANFYAYAGMILVIPIIIHLINRDKNAWHALVLLLTSLINSTWLCIFSWNNLYSWIYREDSWLDRKPINGMTTIAVLIALITLIDIVKRLKHRNKQKTEEAKN
jgi:hypothetical protein